jgi:GntR family transcriptional repressor for pyruvate dehydrogenase complex
VFHSAVADAAGNQVFALIASSLNWIWDGSLMGVHYPGEIRKVVIDAHARIHRAIEEHNSERAFAAMSVHLTDYSSYLERHYPHVLDARLEWSQI